MSSDYKGHDGAKIEPWVKFPYEVESFKYIGATSDARDMQGVENELGFPSKNRFIPKDLRMHNNNSNNEGEEEKLLAVNGSNNINDGDVTLEVTPKVIYNECGTLRLWAKLGCREFKTQPKASMYFNANLLIEEDQQQSVHDTMCLKMFVLMLEDSVNKDIYYPAHVAANECSVHVLAQIPACRSDSTVGGSSGTPFRIFKGLRRDQSLIREEDRFQKVKERHCKTCKTWFLKSDRTARFFQD